MKQRYFYFLACFCFNKKLQLYHNKKSQNNLSEIKCPTDESEPQNRCKQGCVKALLILNMYPKNKNDWNEKGFWFFLLRRTMGKYNKYSWIQQDISYDNNLITKISHCFDRSISAIYVAVLILEKKRKQQQIWSKFELSTKISYGNRLPQFFIRNINLVST